MSSTTAKTRIRHTNTILAKGCECMKKKTYFIISLAIVLILGVICVGAYRNRIVENSLPYMIMVDGQTYQYNVSEYIVSTQEIPEDAVEGYIAKVVPVNEWPNDNQTANFGEVGWQYWMYDNKIYIKTTNYYDIFLPIKN